MIPSHYMKKFIAVGITSNTITISFLNSALEDCSKMIEPLNTCGQAFGLPEGGPREREREREVHLHQYRKCQFSFSCLLSYYYNYTVCIYIHLLLYECSNNLLSTVLVHNLNCIIPTEIWNETNDVCSQIQTFALKFLGLSWWQSY